MLFIVGWRFFVVSNGTIIFHDINLWFLFNDGDEYGEIGDDNLLLFVPKMSRRGTKTVPKTTPKTRARSALSSQQFSVLGQKLKPIKIPVKKRGVRIDKKMVNKT